MLQVDLVSTVHIADKEYVLFPLFHIKVLFSRTKFCCHVDVPSRCITSFTYSNILPFVSVYSYYYYGVLAEISNFSSDILIDCSKSLKIMTVSCMKWLRVVRI